MQSLLAIVSFERVLLFEAKLDRDSRPVLAHISNMTVPAHQGHGRSFASSQEKGRGVPATGCAESPIEPAYKAAQLRRAGCIPTIVLMERWRQRNRARAYGSERWMIEARPFNSARSLGCVQQS